MLAAQAAGTPDDPWRPNGGQSKELGIDVPPHSDGFRP